MGSQKWINQGKPWKEYEVVDEIDGIKVLKKKSSRNNTLPSYSDSAKYYATYDKDTGEIKQISCYDDTTHAKLYDIDWEHDHGEFKKGTPHVHYYDNLKKSSDAQELTTEQMELYKKFKGRYVENND